MIHHLAIAVRNIEATHYFYTEVMDFRLVSAVKRQAPGGGWTKHLFYDMGDGTLIAFWDLRGLENVQFAPESWRSSISTGLGLPGWVNHIAFECADREDFERRKKRWLDHGYHVSEVDHDFIRSCYTYDPDGNWVEWTYRCRPLTEDDRLKADAILADDSPAIEADYELLLIRSTVKKRRFAPKDSGAPSGE